MANKILRIDLKISFEEILKALKEYSDISSLMVLDLEMNVMNHEVFKSISSQDKNFLDLEKRIRDSSIGILMSFDELLLLEKSFLQTINLHAVRYRSDIEEYSSRQKRNYDDYEVSLQLHDSTCWFIFARDERLLTRLYSNFKDYAEIEASDNVPF